MTRLNLFTFLCLIATAGVQAQDSLEAEPPRDKKFFLLVSVNQTTEDFRWSIAGNIEGNSPNIYSELIWKDLKGTPFKLDAQWNFWKSFMLRTRVSRLNITSGKVTDSDYEGDNRTQPVFDVTVESNVGSITSFTAEAGYRILKGEKFQLDGYAGYSATQQHLFLLDPKGLFDNRLRSTYEPSWKGVLVSVDANLFLSKVISISPHATYHQVNYESTANWNLIDNFQHPESFKHTAKGYGIEGTIQVQIHLNDDFGFFLASTYSEWKTGKGTDILYLADGQVQHTQLNEVIRESLSFGIGMMVSF
jgi:hypothetical protein